MIYMPERHEGLVATCWDEAEVRREIKEIVRATEAALQPGLWWPHHPRDVQAKTDAPHKTLYTGASGVMWALDLLAQKQLVTLARPYESLWYQACEDYLSLPDTGEVVPSWFLGRSFLLLMAMLRGPLAKREGCADRLFEVVSANIANPAREMLWGSPATMLGALFAYEATGEERWANAYRRNAEWLWEEWAFDENLQCDLWTQDLYGTVDAYYGAAHGFAGNAFALLRGMHLFGEQRRERLLARVTATVKRLATRTNGFANWPTRRNRASMNHHLQWCHGAPGFLLAFGRLVPSGRDPAFDRLLLEGGALTWHAGPSKKGACLCHGTDGNGMALLALFERTGDAVWRDRARMFAMRAIEQSRQSQLDYGERRYTLWTGDLGLAVFLAACLDGKAHMPGLDFV